MIQGTGSDVGKSLMVAGLCRAFLRRGLKVRPFKPQNMSNNAAVCEDGGEIGRAQALQARAAGINPNVDMNPVLLKPQSETGSQLIVRGKLDGVVEARRFHLMKDRLLGVVIDSFHKIGDGADLVLVEGAGSPAEVNLRENDIANMGFAVTAGVPVILVGDIDRGGVIASIVGTHALLPKADRAMIKGFIVNKFRGDACLFKDALGLISERTGWASFGLVPFFPDAARLPAEDTLSLDNRGASSQAVEGSKIRIAVPRLPRISNFDDLDPLIGEKDVFVEIIEPGNALPGDADIIVLPGTKSVIADTRFLKNQGWDIDIKAHLRRRGMVLGLCGGFQMLGLSIADPQEIEGAGNEVEGLGLLDMETVIESEKSLRRITAVEPTTGKSIHGYEIHMGKSKLATDCRPWLTLDDGKGEGAISTDGRVMGSYIHGLFAADDFRHAFLTAIRRGRVRGADFEPGIDKVLDSLAQHLEQNIDLDGLLKTASHPGRL